MNRGVRKAFVLPRYALGPAGLLEMAQGYAHVEGDVSAAGATHAVEMYSSTISVDKRTPRLCVHGARRAPHSLERAEECGIPRHRF